MNEITYITLPSNLDFVPALRGLISEISSVRGFDSKDRFRIETIVDEMCNNAIEHGSNDGDNIYFIFTVKDDEVELVVRDKGGKKGNINKLKGILAGEVLEDDDPMRKRGRGLDMIKMLSDNVSISITENGETEMKVTKKRKKVEKK